MSDRYIVLAVEKTSAERVGECLQDCLGPAFFSESATHVAGLRVEVSDASQEADYAAKFLEARGLEDDNPVWRELDSKAFAVEVEISAAADSVGGPLKEAFGDSLAKTLSAKLGVRVVLSIENGYVPFGIYRNGHKIRDFSSEYSQYFASRDWAPRPSR